MCVETLLQPSGSSLSCYVAGTAAPMLPCLLTQEVWNSLQPTPQQHRLLPQDPAGACVRCIHIPPPPFYSEVSKAPSQGFPGRIEAQTRLVLSVSLGHNTFLTPGGSFFLMCKLLIMLILISHK